MFCHFVMLALCPILLSLSRVVLCFVLLKRDWMERSLYCVLHSNVLWKSLGSMNNKRGGLILYAVCQVY